MSLKDEPRLLDEYTHISTGFPSMVRQVVSSADIDDLLALTDGPDSHFGTRRAFAEAVGVGESTVAGWIKDAKLPPLGKAVVGLLHAASRLKSDAENYERESSNLGDMIVRDGNSFMIVSFHSAGSIGEIAARNIPDKKTADRLVSHRELRHALMLAIGVLNEHDTKLSDYDHQLISHLESLVADDSKEPPPPRNLDDIKEWLDKVASEDTNIEGGGTHA